MSGPADRLLGPVERLLACNDRPSLEGTLAEIVQATTGATAVQIWGPAPTSCAGGWAQARRLHACGEDPDPIDPTEALARGSQALLPSGWWLSRGDSLALVYAAWCEDEQAHAEIDALVTLAEVFAEGLPQAPLEGAGPRLSDLEAPPSIASAPGPRRGLHVSALLAPWARLEDDLAARLDALTGLDGEPYPTGARALPQLGADGEVPILRLAGESPNGLEIQVDWPGQADADRVAELSHLARILGQLVPASARVERRGEDGVHLRLRL